MLTRTGASLFSIALALLLAFTAGGGGLLHAAQGENKAGVVVQFADGSTRTYCVAFEGDSISGLDLLLKTGLAVKIEGHGGMGALVCKIGADGCDYPGEPCACKSYGPGGVYWTYHHLREGKFKVSSQGASSYRVRPGEVDGWAWSAGTAPAVFTFGQICAPDVVAPAVTPTVMKATATSTRPAQATAVQRATSTAIPTRSPVRTATVRRAAPTATARPKSPTPPRRTSTRTATRTPSRTPASTATVRRAGAEGGMSGVALLERGASLVIEAALRDVSRVE